MANKQVIVNEAIAKVIAEVTKAAMKALEVAKMERPQGMRGPRMGGPIMKQPNFNW